jgi:putative membrane protein
MLLVVGMVSAQTSSTTQQPMQNMKVATVDKDFMMKAAEGGMAEVMESQLALTHATNDDVKSFAQRMVDDHTKANNELKDLAAKKGVTLPTTPNAKQRAEQDRLSKLNGADFDREYMRNQVKAHNETIALFEKEARSGKDQDVKTWAEQTLPTLREHLRMANDLSGKLGGPLGKVGR